MFGDLQLIIIAILGAIASGAGAYFIGGWRGEKKAKDKREIEELNRNIATGKELDDAFREVDGLSDDDVTRLLRERSKRKP